MPRLHTACHKSVLTLSLLLCACGLCIDVPVSPVSPDERLTVELVAQEPEISTPTGLAVDERGRIWVVENNTHFRPKNYKGFASDRIQVFEDFAPDGHARKISTFADGFQNSMSILLAPGGAVYLATRSEIFLPHDTNAGGDARATGERKTILKLETTGNYPHNGLAGLALGHDGNLYAGLGENLGVPYKLIGSDGTVLSGGGEGGNIYRCKPDGSKLERIATGFWNPFGLGFDAFGRLFCVDNDPDGCPPCRLLHVIPGGDYGYRFRYGRNGHHPFQAWNGEIPGTLPMVSGTGEAPCTVLAYEFRGLPKEYRGDLLVTSWGDHSIQRFKLEAEGASFKSHAEILVKGTLQFRPVGMAVAPDGSLVVSDWASTSYSVNGKGRLWRIRMKAVENRPDEDALSYAALLKGVSIPEYRAKALEQGLRDTVPKIRAAAVRFLAETPSVETEQKLLAVLRDDKSPAVRLEAVQGLREKSSAEALVPLLVETDPFIFSACVDALGGLGEPASLLKAPLKHSPSPDARTRLGVLLALRRTGNPAAREALPKFLLDADPAVRRAAVQWIGEERITEFSAQLNEVAKQPLSHDLFAAYLAARVLLSEKPGKVETPENLMAQFFSDAAQPPSVRAMALRNLRVDHPAVDVAKLKALISGTGVPPVTAGGDARATTELREEAIRALALHPHPSAQAELRTLAADAALPPQLRPDVIAGLARSADASPETRTILLGSLAHAAPAELQREALRALRAAATQKDVHLNVREYLAWLVQDKPEACAERAEQALIMLKAGLGSAETWKNLSGQPEAPSKEIAESFREAEARVSETLRLSRPKDEAEWLALLAKPGDSPGDAAAGARIFFHARGPQCFVCHRIDGRGGNAGPDLSTIGQALAPEKLAQSILDPAREVAPQFVVWTITLKDGRSITGLIQDEDMNGILSVADAQGKKTRINPSEVERRAAQKGSLMPDNLIDSITRQEMRDLLEFLSQRGKADKAK